MTTRRRSRRITVWGVRLGLAAFVAPLLFVAWDQATYNFGEVEPHHIYRSGQMPARALEQTLREHHIKTVLNLRGSNRDACISAHRTAPGRFPATRIRSFQKYGCIGRSHPLGQPGRRP